MPWAMHRQKGSSHSASDIRNKAHHFNAEKTHPLKLHSPTSWAIIPNGSCAQSQAKIYKKASREAKNISFESSLPIHNLKSSFALTAFNKREETE